MCKKSEQMVTPNLTLHSTVDVNFITVTDVLNLNWMIFYIKNKE